MKTGAALADILYLLFSILFYLLLIAFAGILALEAFTDDGKIGMFSSNFHSSRGYTVPVDFNIEPDAPMLDNYIVSNYKEEIDETGKKVYTYMPQYARPITAKDSLDYKTIITLNDWVKNDNYQLKSSMFVSEGYVYVNPKTLLNKFIILFRTYANLILLVITFFLLKNIFRTLRINIEFSHKLYKLIQGLGIVLLLSILLTYISNLILGNSLYDIRIDPLNKDLTYVEIFMTPRLDFDFTLFVVGLSLLILSSLLKAGNKMRQENDLTI